MSEDDIEIALRSSLHDHADRAPLAGDVVARTLATADRRPAARTTRRRREWRTWGVPVLAAGAVGAIVAAVVGLEHVSRQESAPATERPSSVPSTTRAASSSPAVPAPVVTHTLTTTVSPSSSATSVDLHGVRVLDLTFAGPDNGWALGSARCLTGSGRCTAVLRTTDGRTWRGIPGGLFNVAGVHGCADPCISHLRFATDEIGYAYGPDALLMTTNGGATWQRQGRLGADALETLDGNVILVRTGNTAHPLFDTAPIGTSQWTPVGSRLAERAQAARPPWLARAGRRAVVIGPGRRHPDFAVFRSTDDGAHWAAADQSCPAAGAARLQASSMSMAPDGTITVACSSYSGSASVGAILTSHDGGRTFTATSVGRATPALDELAAASSSVLVGSAAGQAYRSTDGGVTWSRVSQVSGSVIFVGFENAKTGRVVTDDAIYTTRDAGQTWTRMVLP